MLRQVFPVLVACVMASLVAVDHEAFRKPLDLVQLGKHRHDKTEIDSFGHGPGDDFVRAGILECGKIAPAVASVVDIADVCEKVLARFRCPELTVELVCEYVKVIINMSEMAG